MKLSFRAGSILAVLVLTVVGCDPAEPKSEGPPVHEEHKESKLGDASPAAPVTPSPTPILPDPLNPEMKADEKKDEAKPAEKKLETPK